MNIKICEYDIKIFLTKKMRPSIKRIVENAKYERAKNAEHFLLPLRIVKNTKRYFFVLFQY